MLRRPCRLRPRLGLCALAAALTVGSLTVGLSAQPVSAQTPQLPWMNPSLPPEQRAELLLAAMRLDEKIQQIFNFPVYNEDLDDGDPDNGVGCDFQSVGRHIEGIPALAIPTFRFANGGTGIRGGDCLPEPTATGFPSQVASAATFEPSVMFQWGQVLSNEIRAWAHQTLWGPGMNMIRTPWGGRNHEYMSEDPYLTGRIATEIVRGVQASGETHATVKHFAANESEYELERWTAASRVPSRAMHEIYLLPFEMAVRDADPASVMCAYPHVNFEWACDSSPLLRQTLRERWGFDGYVVSDRRAQHSTVEAILAGTDFELDFAPEWYTHERVRAALAAGQITMADLDDLLRERYIKMFEFGMFDEPYDEIDFSQVDRQANSNVSARAAAESIVLLKNDNRLLPLRPNVDSIALIGASWFAGQATMPPRSGEENELTNVITDPELTVSPEEGLENTLDALDSDAEVTYNDGDVIADAVALAEDSDYVILMVGDNPRETDDVDALSLPSVTGTNQELLIPAILEANRNTVVVLKTQGMILMPWLDDALAVVEAWYPGQQDGNVVADVLFGRNTPNGKLPVTFGNTDHEAAYSSTAQYPGLREDNGLGGGTRGFEPIGLPQLVTHYTEDLEVGYRWYLANQVPPLFPFGHGLSYTTFEYSDLAVSTQSTGGSTVAVVSYTITNTGLRRGKETSQVYLTLPREANEPPKRLVGFQKVDLRPGRSVRVSVTIDSASSNHPFSYFSPDDPEDLMAWADGEWLTPSGTYTVSVGGSSAQTPLRQSFELVSSGSVLTAPPAPAAPAAPPEPAAARAEIEIETLDSGDTAEAAPPGKIEILSRRLSVNGSRAAMVRLGCPVSIGPRGCVGVLTATRATPGARAQLARTRISIPAGRTTAVSLRFAPKQYSAIVRAKVMRVRLAVQVRDADGAAQRASRIVQLSGPRR